MDVNVNYGSFPEWRVMLQDNEGNGNVWVQLEKATLKSDLPFRRHSRLLVCTPCLSPTHPRLALKKDKKYASLDRVSAPSEFIGERYFVLRVHA